LTIDAMQAAAIGREGALSADVRVWALDATKDARDRDDYMQAEAIFRAVKRNIRFRGEYSETVQTPLVTLQVRAGDCDDHATLIAALLRSIGIPARFKTISTDPLNPDTFTHVYALAGLRRGNKIVQWLPLDTTVPWSSPGWEAPRALRARIWGGGLSGLALGDPPEQQTQQQADQQPLGQKAKDWVGVINSIGQSASNIAASFRNGGNTTNFSAQSMPGGITGSVGTSMSTLAVGGLVATVAALALLRKR